MKKDEKKMSAPEKKARALLAVMPLADLIDQFELTADAPITIELATVRGWLMDEIQSRCPESFDKWLDSDAGDDYELKYYILGWM